MNQRIRRLADSVLAENGRFACADAHIKSLLAEVTDEERLRIIREEYSKIIKVDEDSLIAGQYPSMPFYQRVEVDYEAIWRDAIAPIKFELYEKRVHINGGQHFSANFEMVLTQGFSGLKAQIEEKRISVTDDEQKGFLDELHYVTDAITAWVTAHADALRMAADKASSKERRSELLQMASVCERVPFYPATTFREAVQSYFFTFMLYSDGLGCIDRYLYPYYLADVEKGILTREEALGLIEELFIKIFSRFGTDEIRSGNNHGVIGGYTPDGECGHNECTSLILEAIADLPVWRPQISYRVTAKTTADQLKEVVDAQIRRPDLIMLLNDDVIAAVT